MDKMQERIQIIRDAVSFKKTARIPTISNYWTYMSLDAGHKLSEALYDYGMLHDDIIRFHKKYSFDAYHYLGARNPFRVTDAVDGNKYTIDDERGAFNIDDYEVMREDEYRLFAEDPFKFLWSVAVPRKCKALSRPGSFEAVQKAVAEYDEYNAFVGKTAVRMLEEFHVPQTAQGFFSAPFEMCFNFLRGIKGLSIDMRRRPEELDIGLEAVAKFTNVWEASTAALQAPQPENAVFGGLTYLLGHSICSPKQFEKYFWPLLKHWADLCAKTGKKLLIFSEAQMLSFADFFQDLPKGAVCIQMEQDDVFEARKRLPNIAICGGMTAVSLGQKTKAECIELAKRLVNEVGQDGGFIMAQNKMMTYANDAKPENILAVQEFCATYAG
jgi:hypothetical protein